MPLGLSNTDLANAALTKLGEATIGDLSDTTETARLVNLRFGSVRDAVLRGHNWNVATRRATLARLANTPPFEYEFAYGLPTGFIKVVELTQDGSFVAHFRVEQHNKGSVTVPDYQLALLTDNSTAELRYIARIDAGEMDALLYETVAAALAFDLSLKLSKSEQTRQVLRAEFKELESRARFADASEQSSTPWFLDSWEQARAGGTDEPLGDAAYREMWPR